MFKGYVKKILIFILLVITIIIVLIFIYLNIGQYTAESNSIQLFNSNCINEDNYAYCDNNSDTGLIIYPGAKVDYRSYSYLLNVDANLYIAEFPYNLSILNSDIDQDIIVTNNENSWFILGHYLGGVSAISEAEKNPKEYDGVITLGSYPSHGIESSKQNYLAFFATNDGLVDDYKGKEKLFPKDAQIVEIKGGNHSGYGEYGFQKNDGKATISKDKQHQIIVSNINTFIHKTEK